MLLAAALLAAWGTAAQESEESQLRRGIFLDSVDVSLTNVEVHVTRGGEPVPDLTADDFEVFDDGVPVDVTHFYRVDAGRRALPPAAGSDAPDTVPLPATREPATVVVLVDQPFLAPASRKLVFTALSERLDPMMADGVEVMVVSKDRQVEVVQPLTSRRADVDLALDRLARVATPDHASEVRRMVQRIEQGNGAASRVTPAQAPTPQTVTALSDARAAYQDARGFSQEIHAQVLHSLGLVSRFVGSLAGLPGRKAVLYVADRLPVRPGEVVWRAWFERYGFEWGSQLGVTSVETAIREHDVSAAVHELVADASANRVAFYPVGTGAAAVGGLASPESRGSASPTRRFLRDRESDDGLHWLASGSGGRAGLGRGKVDAFLDALRQDLTTYYSLGFPSPHRGDGETHELEVRVRGGDDLEVRYLAEYRDKTAEQQMEERTLASLVLGAGDNPLDVRVTLGKPVRQPDDLYAVPMEIRVPVANLVLLPDRAAHRGKVTIQLIVRDDEGRFSETVRIRMPIEIPNATILRALADSAVYATELVMRRGRQTIGVGVRDDFGGVGATVNVEVDVDAKGRG